MYFHLWGNVRNVWIWRLECAPAKTNMLLVIIIIKMFHCSGSSKIRINKTIDCLHIWISFSICVYKIYFFLPLLAGKIEFIISSEGKYKEWLDWILDIRQDHNFQAKIQTELHKCKPLNVSRWTVECETDPQQQQQMLRVAEPSTGELKWILCSSINQDQI